MIHSPSFRRLQGKTQLFPGHESDFFRNRLTHSLEVAQIAESIACQLNYDDPYLADHPIEPRICFTAALLHDIGHPPFGHNGEDALDERMAMYGGFEGNAQTLRIVTQLEKKVIVPGQDCPLLRRSGLNLTYRQLAAVLKYDKTIASVRKGRKRPEKGFYAEDISVVRDIKKNVAPYLEGDAPFKTIECKIMDLADDIAYSTYDIEDAFKAGFLTPYSILSSNAEIFERVAKKVQEETKEEFQSLEAFNIFLEMFSTIDTSGFGGPNNVGQQEEDVVGHAVKIVSEMNAVAESGRLRTDFTSNLVGQFIEAVQFNLNEEIPALSGIHIDIKHRQKIETLKRFAYESTIQSSRLKLAEYRGKEIVGKIFDSLAAKDGHVLLPNDQLELWEAADAGQSRMRVISDFIAGMTDRYAVEFYGRLFSDNPVSMFKTA